MNHPAATIVQLFLQRVLADGARPALGIKRGGAYGWLTWHDVAEDVRRLAAGLAAQGVKPGDHVAQVSENRLEWVLADLAIQLCQAVHVPIHPTLSGPQIAWQLRHAGCAIALLSGPHQVAKLQASPGAPPSGLQCFVYDACDGQVAGKELRTFGDLLTGGDAAAGAQLEEQALAGLTPESLATILYTSGTTGEPKGVMLTQGNLAANTLAVLEAFGEDRDKVRVNFLPLSHIFARTCDLYSWIAEGSRLALAESRETVLADCQAVHPTYLNGVPYFYDKVYRALCDRGRQGEPGSLREILGGRIEACCAGGAALADYLHDFYHGHGVPILQGYGLTESSPVITVSTKTRFRRGSCGFAIPGAEVQIASDGEILTHGPHVMRGYYKNSAATAESLTEGWLRTGDIGRLDDDGFLYITGRKKELIVTSSGKNIAPVLLESLLTQDPLIAQAMVIGDGRSYLTALIVPQEARLLEELAKTGRKPEYGPELLASAEVQALIRERIDCQLAQLSPHEQVRKFHPLPTPFTIDSGELTPKLTLRRSVIEQKHAAAISAMYGSRPNAS